MVELAFVSVPGQDWLSLELVAALRAELTSLGFGSLQTEEGFPDPDADRVYVLTPPGEDLALEAAEALGDDPVLWGRTIIVCAEQPAGTHFEQNLALLRRAGAVFDINPQAVREIRRRGVEADYLPLGYSAQWDQFEAAADRDIDVLFMSPATPRRTLHLASYTALLARRTCHLQLSDHWVSDPERSPSLLAARRWNLLARARILLSLHRSEQQHFDWLLTVAAIHRGCVVLSEHSSGRAPLEPGSHVFTGSAESLGLLADRLLDDQTGRLAEVAGDAYQLIREQRPMRETARRLAAAAARLCRGAVPASAPKWTAADRTPIPRVDWMATAARADDPVRRALKDTRLDLLDLRRDLNRIELSLSSPGNQMPPPVRRVAWSSAWSGSAGARVTVITPLYNHGAEIGEALDSVARSSYRDFEVVVVDDGSTDGSGQVVREWMQSHDQVPAMLVEHPVNQGLGAARNSGIDFARGEYCFMLDADNRILPRCLEILLLALDGNAALTFAYPILEVFGDVQQMQDRGGWCLENWLPWHRAHTRFYSADALAMIRTSALRQLGGYTLDRRLYGLEDRDLWCRMAERGHDGTLVPQVLARYRSSPSSMLAVSELSVTTARTALAEHSPTLFAEKVRPAS